MKARPRVYVAGAFLEFAIVREAQRKLIEHGFEIAFDWTQGAEETIAKGGDVALGDHERFDAARKDFNAVAAARYFLMITPGPGVVTRGAWFEMGIAGASGATVVITGPTRGACIFEALFESRETVDAGIDFLQRVAFG